MAQFNLQNLPSWASLLSYKLRNVAPTIVSQLNSMLRLMPPQWYKTVQFKTHYWSSQMLTIVVLCKLIVNTSGWNLV